MNPEDGGHEAGGGRLGPGDVGVHWAAAAHADHDVPKNLETPSGGFALLGSRRTGLLDDGNRPPPSAHFGDNGKCPSPSRKN